VVIADTDCTKKSSSNEPNAREGATTVQKADLLELINVREHLRVGENDQRQLQFSGSDAH
jgi:hypothetical protein